MTRERLAAMSAADDQDQAECDAWMRESAPEHLAAVWWKIQQMGGPNDPLGEVVSRFAQLAFSQSFARVHGAKDPTENPTENPT